MIVSLAIAMIYVDMLDISYTNYTLNVIRMVVGIAIVSGLAAKAFTEL